MAIPICKRAGARHVVVTDVNPYRLNLAHTMGADLALDVRTEKVADAMQKLGMKEGFDIALEMSGNPKAFADILPNMSPWQGGGEMIVSVTLEKSTFKKPPHRFEAGTPNIAGAIGLAAAIDYIEQIGRAVIFEHDSQLAHYAADRLPELPGTRVFGPKGERGALVGFVMGEPWETNREGRVLVMPGPLSDTDPRTEVGQVGTAMNHMPAYRSRTTTHD